MCFNTYIPIILFVSCSLSVIGQRTETAVYYGQEKSRLIIEIENDLLFQSDNNYTVGLAISYTNNALKKTPAQLILRSRKAEYVTFSGFGFQQRIYTPHSIVDPYGIENDRPYSAYMLATNFSVLIKPKQRLKLSNEIGIGVLGNFAGGKEVQTFVHEIIDSDLPIGWDDQLGNTFLIDYQFRIEKGFFGEWTAQHFIPFMAARIGTLTDRINIGIMAKLGNNTNMFTGTTEHKELKDRIIWEFVYEVDLQGVFYDATLEGGLFSNDMAALDRKETIARQYGMRFGVNLYYRALSFRYMAKFNSNTFHAGGADRYGSVNFGIAF